MGTLRLSAHVLAGDKAQWWSQLTGRLMGEASPAIVAGDAGGQVHILRLEGVQ